MFAGKVHDLRHLGFRHLIGKNAAFADAVVVHMQHDPGCSLPVLVEEPLQDMHHELHRGVVVVEDQHAVKIRPLGLRLGLGNDGGTRVAPVAAFFVIVSRRPHPGRGAGAPFGNSTGLIFNPCMAE